MNGPSLISLAYSMMKLCVEIVFVPHALIVTYINLGRKYCPIFAIMQIINGLKLYIMYISIFVYPPLAIDTRDEAF